MTQPSNVFRLHHNIQITYPVVPHDRRHNYITFPIHNALNRYEPRPLIADADVIENGERIEDENAIFSSSNTDPISLDVWHAKALAHLSSLEPSSECELLMRDMQFLTACNGSSDLDVVTFTTGKNKTVWLGIACDTELIFKGGEGRTKMLTYNMPLSDFEAVKTSELWHANILDVIYRKSDRAYHHVKLQIEDDDLEDAETKWKPQRMPDYQSVNNTTVVRDLSSLDDDSTCPICTSEFDTEYSALRLRCHDKHIICSQCYPIMVRETGPDVVACPWCRCKLFTAAETDTFKWGTDGRAYYAYLGGNERYNEFESFVRANADLDKQRADESGMCLTVHLGLFAKIWHTLVDGALLETAESTPLHLQPARSPELQNLSGEILGIFNTFTGIPTTHMLYELITDAIDEKLTEHYRSVVLCSYMTKEEQQHVTDANCLCATRMRPGFQDFAIRTLSRTLQFAHLRACRDSPECAAWHYHGDKIYYNPDLVHEL